MAGRPAEIKGERLEQLRAWCLPAPRGEGLDGRAAHARAEAAGWDVSYTTVYRARRQLLEQEVPAAAPPPVAALAPGAARAGVEALRMTAIANPMLNTQSPARGRFTL